MFVNGVHIDNNVAERLFEYISKTRVAYFNEINESNAVMCVLFNNGDARIINYTAGEGGKDVKDLIELLVGMHRRGEFKKFPQFIRDTIYNFLDKKVELGLTVYK